MLGQLNKNELKNWIDAIDLRPVKCEELTEDRVWASHQTEIWQARRFVGFPTFYPVYQWRDYYSYSPLSLLLKKGALDLDADVVNKVKGIADTNFLPGQGTLDRGIKRLGGPMPATFKIRTPEHMAQAIAGAMKTDIAFAEKNNPGFTNIILCGGKDSLNMLLLPWKNPVIVASGAPNYPLVKQFIADNDLPYDIIELKDDYLVYLPQEILSNFCRNNLEHCRWGAAQVDIVKDLGGKAIFWKGQLGRFMTPRWDTYTHSSQENWHFIKRVCSLWGGRGEYWAKRNLKKWGVTQRKLYRAHWTRGAMWQGAHMSIQRQLTGALTLSVYHGAAMCRVMEQVELNGAVPYDVRPLVGDLLHGRRVKYPETNPCPPPSTHRREYSYVQPFLDVLNTVGFSIKGA